MLKFWLFCRIENLHRTELREWNIFTLQIPLTQQVINASVHTVTHTHTHTHAADCHGLHISSCSTSPGVGNFSYCLAFATYWSVCALFPMFSQHFKCPIFSKKWKNVAYDTVHSRLAIASLFTVLQASTVRPSESSESAIWMQKILDASASPHGSDATWGPTPFPFRGVPLRKRGALGKRMWQGAKRGGRGWKQSVPQSFS